MSNLSFSQWPNLLCQGFCHMSEVLFPVCKLKLICTSNNPSSRISIPIILISPEILCYNTISPADLSYDRRQWSYDIFSPVFVSSNQNPIFRLIHKCHCPRNWDYCRLLLIPICAPLVKTSAVLCSMDFLSTFKTSSILFAITLTSEFLTFSPIFIFPVTLSRVTRFLTDKTRSLPIVVSDNQCRFYFVLPLHDTRLMDHYLWH